MNDDTHPLNYRQSVNHTSANNKPTTEQENVTPFTKSDMEMIQKSIELEEKKPDCYPAVMRDIENHGNEQERMALHRLENKSN